MLTSIMAVGSMKSVPTMSLVALLLWLQLLWLVSLPSLPSRLPLKLLRSLLHKNQQVRALLTICPSKIYCWLWILHYIIR